MSFRNKHGVTWTQPYHLLLKWRIERVFNRRKGSTLLPRVRRNDGRRLDERSPHLTWIGHATFILRLGGRLAVTDPIWRERIYYLRRLNTPGVPIEQLPPVDVVTVTHNHYDHLDLPTLVALDRLHRPLFLVPRNNAPILERAGIQRIVELDWWESYKDGDLEVTLVPAQHWSQRGVWKNRCLWGGYIYRGPEGTAYHAGDTAFEPRMFAEIAAYCPSIDWAMLPIGGYEPEWFLSTQHVNPEDAGRAFDILGARILVAMHYGTFDLTDEPVGEPLERLERWLETRGLPRERLWALDIGETRSLLDSRV